MSRPLSTKLQRDWIILKRGERSYFNKLFKESLSFVAESLMTANRQKRNSKTQLTSSVKTSVTLFSLCGTIASRHLVGRWSRDYHMCRLVFLRFFPRPRCFQIRGKRRWMRSSWWRLEFVLERRKVAKQILKNDENKAFFINSNKRLFTQLFR